MINNQNKSKIFLVIIAILLIANIAILAFFLHKKEPEKQAVRPDRKAYITNFLKNEIGFNQQQLIQYDTLSKLHREKIKSLYETAKSIRSLQLKQLVKADFSDSAINQEAEQSATAQKVMEVQSFNHIKNIRELCTPAQLPKYDSLFIKVFNRMGEGRKKSGK